MEIKLNNLKIRNFKGIREFELKPDGKSINIGGDNGTGKTTLYDAFLWLLFGKNSVDQSDSKFDWKPLDKNNKPINHLETSVEAELLIGNNIKNLKRIISEKWTKKRGSITEAFDGHTTTYQIDGISVKQKDYKDFLDELIGEETFKMLTNVSYFPEILDWKTRRNTLLDMVGDITKQDVIKANNDLKPLADLDDNRTIDDWTAFTKQQMANVNKQIKDIPQRIDEVDRSLPDISGLDRDSLEKDKLKLSAELSVKQTELISIENGSIVGSLNNKLKEQELYYREEKAEFELDWSDGLEHWETVIHGYEQDKLELKDQQAEINRMGKDLNWEIDILETQIKRLESENEKNRERYKEIQAKQFPPFDEHKNSCPTCGQDYPEEKMLEIQENYELEADVYRFKKAKELEELQTIGKETNAKVAELNEKILSLQKQLDELKTDEIDKKLAENDELTKEVLEKLDQLRANKPKFEESEVALKIKDEIKKIEDDITIAKTSNQTLVDKANSETSEIMARINEVNDKLYLLDQHAKQSARKEELIEEEGKLSIEYGKLEQQLMLLEEFVRTKVNLLTESINSQFKLVKFKLFDTAINGGLVEVCEPTVGGANYSTGLNNAMRINAGLDIINTLMRHKGIKVPIFIDNAEGVNEFIDIGTQLITLSVTKDKTLKVEEI